MDYQANTQPASEQKHIGESRSIIQAILNYEPHVQNEMLEFIIEQVMINRRAILEDQMSKMDYLRKTLEFFSEAKVNIPTLK
jgi:hypothetical protein